MSEIWLVNQYAITPDLPGGTRHYDLAVELVRRGFRVKVFASDLNLALRKRTKLQPGQLYTIEQRDGVEFVWVRSTEYERNNWRRAWNMFTFSWNFMRVAQQLARKGRPSVILGSSPHPFAALAAQRIAAKLRARFFLELRDLWPQALIDMGGLSEKHPGVRLMRWLESFLYSRAERFVTLAKGSQTYLTERGVNPDRILFIPNGVHLGHFQPSMNRAEARRKYGFDRFTIVYAGAHGPANNLETLLQAGKLVEDLPVEFVLVGDGPSKVFLTELAQTLKLTNVRLLEPVPKGEIADLLSAADAGVITLRNAKAFEYGISPNKLFDYMAASKPILCSVPGEMANLIREADAGITITPEDPDALAAAVHECFGMSEAARAAFGARGRAFLEQHFRREVLVNRLAEAMR